jgi:hypothetical protein
MEVTMSRTAQSRMKEKSDEQTTTEALQLKEPSVDEIQARAYNVYLERGSIDGHDLEDWLQAERELRER